MTDSNIENSDFEPSKALETEKETNIQHPEYFSKKGSQDKYVDIIGLGVREKKILGLLKIKVYSIGLYINKNNLGSWVKQTNKDNSKMPSNDQAIEGILTGGIIPNMIRIVLVTDKVNRERFVESFNESLGPQMTQDDDQKKMTEFRKVFDKAEFKSGTQFMLWQQGGHKLDIYYNGNKIGSVESQNLCKGLLNIYIGKNTVSPNLKRSAQRVLKQYLDEFNQ